MNLTDDKIEQLSIECARQVLIPKWWPFDRVGKKKLLRAARTISDYLRAVKVVAESEGK